MSYDFEVKLRFKEMTKARIWAKGIVVPGYDPSILRRDAFGAPMLRSKFGDCSSEYGWEMDHVIPHKHGGSDSLLNRQPLNWRSNRHKSDKMPTQI